MFSSVTIARLLTTTIQILTQEGFTRDHLFIISIIYREREGHVITTRKTIAAMKMIVIEQEGKTNQYTAV